MAPKKASNRPPASDPEGMFAGMVVFLVENGVQSRRLQIWKQKLVQMGANIEDQLSKKVTHVFAVNSNTLLQQFSGERLPRFDGDVLSYQWLEDSLRSGEKLPEKLYILSLDPGGDSPKNSSKESCPKPANGNNSSGDEQSRRKKIRTSPQNPKHTSAENIDKIIDNAAYESPKTASGSEDSSRSLSPGITSPITPDTHNDIVSTMDPSLPYSPPDLNKNITEIFGKLINIYRALGDDRRSFSYYKAIPVIEKLPFKVESVDQVKHLPAIGKSMRDHIQEIVTTGKLSKLEHFEKDEKVLQRYGQSAYLGKYGALVQPLH